MIRKTLGVLAAVTLILGCSDNSGGNASVTSTTGPAATPAVTVTTVAPTTLPPQQLAPHVFVIMMENNGFLQSFGPSSPMTYLATELTTQGVLLTEYYGTTHASQGNYTAQISGQAPTRSIQGDCSVYTEFVQTGTGEYDQALGDGCVYPANVRTIADQLTERDLTWKAYAEDMAASPDAPATCRHPELGTRDTTFRARATDDYATRHVPFMYFHSVIDLPSCADNVVDLNVLAGDLGSLASTPNLSYIVPDLCGDGHDGRCADGTSGGPKRADEWLRTWVPMILASPAMAAGGLLIITFDEAASHGPLADESSCCGSLPAPNIVTANGTIRPGGGRIGAVLIGAAITAGTVSNTAYNHYSLLCSLERLWGLELLGYAGHPSTPCFGADVYSADPTFGTS